MPKRLLPVEEYAPIRRVMRAVFEPVIPGLAMVEASNAQAADALALGERPDLVILSDRVPDRNTATFVRRLKEDPRTAVVLLTMHSEKAAVAPQASAYLSLPLGLPDHGRRLVANGASGAGVASLDPWPVVIYYPLYRLCRHRRERTDAMERGPAYCYRLICAGVTTQDGLARRSLAGAGGL